MKKQTLNGTWNMCESGMKQTYKLQVPGSVLSCLLENKIIEDPYNRENEYAVRDLFWKDYEFQRTFEVSEELLNEKVIELVCFGLDTLTDIYVNGKKSASTENMHRTFRIPVKELLRVGENDIRIIFKSTFQYIEAYAYEENKKITYNNYGVTPGNQLIRKAHSMFGWDWGAQLPDAGIWRDIELQAYSQAKLQDVRIEQQHDEEEVRLVVFTQLKEIEEKSYRLQLRIYAPTGEETVYTEEVMQTAESRQILTIEKPELWWPNGFGKQPLYRLVIHLQSKENTETGEWKTIDEKEYKIGLRTLVVSKEKDQWGTEFAFQINGVKIFTKGADYIPEDCIYSRITSERIEYLIKSSVRANYNCLRVWGGGYYPSDTFYDLCDRYGIIVWQDLMYACNVYDLTEAFEENIVQETIDNVTRLRHHACLGLWCGNNELESGWHHWADYQTESEYLRADYIKQFEYVLPKAVKQADNTRLYWPSSPSSGGCFDDPDGEDRGDAHYWDVWHGQKPFSEYQKHYFRFCSEFGFQSFPALKTVKTFTRTEDRNIFSSVMESHQKNGAANGKILYYLAENFCYPKDFDSLLYVSQVLQAVAIKTGAEHFRRNRGRCMGSLYWQINDNWPVASWSSIDYFGRWKALHYMAKRFYAPIAASLLCEENTVSAYIQNETLKGTKATVTIALKTMGLAILEQRTYEVAVAELSVEKAGEMDCSDLLGKYGKDSVFAELTVVYADGTTQVETKTFVPYKHLLLPEAVIKATVEEKDDAYLIKLKTDVFAGYVELDFEEADAIFEDNYFDITTGEKEVILQKADIRNGSFANAAEVEKALQIRSIRDSYDFR